MKICSKCKRELEEKSFVLKGGGKRGSICHKCKHDSRNTDYKLRRRGKKYGYSITEKEYNFLLEKQNNSCAICKNVKKLVVDHDHISGKVRGLLCNNCNIVLGIMKDSPEFLRAASQYLLNEEFTELS